MRSCLLLPSAANPIFSAARFLHSADAARVRMVQDNKPKLQKSATGWRWPLS
jgi:hypothetical protein